MGPGRNTLHLKLLIKIKSSQGPRTDHRGTSDRMEAHSEFPPLITTR